MRQELNNNMEQTLPPPVDHAAGTSWVDRRSVLKSAGTLLAASALGSTLEAYGSSNPAPQGASHGVGTGSLRKGMISFMLPHEQFTVPELVDLGAHAEQASFDVLATSDHLQPWQTNERHAGEAWVTMGALGQRTQRAWMGTTVTCPTFRYHPAVVAEAFSSLSLLYPGRIFLGLGSGEALNEEAAVGTWPKWTERSERLIEATEIIRRLWTGQQISHQGKYYNVNARLYDPPARPVPILIAANGPKAMHRSGKYGDGLVTDPDTWKQHKSEFEAGAREAGKDPSQMPVLVEQFVVVGDKKEAERAAELWRFIPKAFSKYYNVRDPEAIEQQAAKDLKLEDVYSTWPVSTDPEVHAKAITKLLDSGVTIVNIHTGQQDQRRVIDFYGKEVLPRVRRSKAAA
jgi:TAT-translocated FGD2 family F420-dependent dehydrogenase